MKNNKMEVLFQERKEKISVFKKWRKKDRPIKRKDLPEDLYIQCPFCKESVVSKLLKKNYYVCPSCQTPLKIGAYQRINMIVDKDSFIEMNPNLTTKINLNFPGYKEKLIKQAQASGLKEACVCGIGKIANQKVAIAVLDSQFFMGSMGSVVGEKITLLVEHATKKDLPLVIFSASGGARMQEGMISLVQMVKTSAAIAKFQEQGLLYISYITNPTTGGVTASFAMLGDIILAEPKALIGFAGPRVIEQTIKKKLPEGFQTSEFLLKQGFVDRIVERKEMRSLLTTLLQMH